MGYYAWGNGEAKLKNGANTLELDSKLNELGTLFYDFESDWVVFSDNEDYFEDDVLDFLDVLSPYITEGSIRYSGDEDRFWRFVFDSKTQTWKQEFGIVDYNFESYTDEQIIKELIERGYAVSKIYSENRDYEWIVCQKDDGDVDITRFIGTKDEVKEHLLRIIQFGRSGVEQKEFKINSVDDLRVIRGGWRVYAKEKYDEGTVEYSAIEVNHIFTT